LRDAPRTCQAFISFFRKNFPPLLQFQFRCKQRSNFPLRHARTHGAMSRSFRNPKSAIRNLTMIAPETFSHIEYIKKRAGHLWRFL